jgi:uncharacterized protein
MGDSVIGFLIPADDIARAEDFYREVFGWRMSPIPGQSSEANASAEERPIIEALPVPVDENGLPLESGSITGLLTRRAPEVSGPSITVQVRDIDETLRHANSHGGRTIVGRQEAGEFGFFAFFADPEGNVIHLWENAVPDIRIGVLGASA